MEFFTYEVCSMLSNISAISALGTCSKHKTELNIARARWHLLHVPFLCFTQTLHVREEIEWGNRALAVSYVFRLLSLLREEVPSCSSLNTVTALRTVPYNVRCILLTLI